ncbi:hypothetical protein GY45DRAFT_1315232 [Cubamyces sp. BRFM 1775]|nr:hypothetical protein GY45DRAFT_1315232 [Cubamyces sp. BRFM 1775]
MIEVTNKQGQPELSAPTDWLAFDYDVATPVYLVVEPSPDAQGSRWSIAWRVGGQTDDKMTAWCYISVDLLPALVDLDEPLQYAYTGPMIKTVLDDRYGVSHAGGVRRHELCTMTLAQRQVIQRLAETTHLDSTSGNSEAEPRGASQAWVTKLMNKMSNAGLTPATAAPNAVAAASNVSISYA